MPLVGLTWVSTTSEADRVLDLSPTPIGWPGLPAGTRSAHVDPATPGVNTPRVVNSTTIPEYPLGCVTFIVCPARSRLAISCPVAAIASGARLKSATIDASRPREVGMDPPECEYFWRAAGAGEDPSAPLPASIDDLEAWK